MISAISIALIQVLSNVPFVVFYDHLIINNEFSDAADGGDDRPVNQWIMLATASTTAGNLTTWQRQATS